jgi:hypothetical protein
MLWKDIVLRLHGPRNSRKPCAGPDRVSGKPPRSARIGRRCVGDVVTWPLSNVDSCATRPVDRSAGPTTGGIIREQSTDWERKRFKHESEMVNATCLQTLRLSGSLFVLLTALHNRLAVCRGFTVGCRPRIWRCKKSHSNPFGLGNRHG